MAGGGGGESTIGRIPGGEAVLRGEGGSGRQGRPVSDPTNAICRSRRSSIAAIGARASLAPGKDEDPGEPAGPLPRWTNRPLGGWLAVLEGRGCRSGRNRLDRPTWRTEDPPARGSSTCSRASAGRTGPASLAPGTKPPSPYSQLAGRARRGGGRLRVRDAESRDVAALTTAAQSEPPLPRRDSPRGPHPRLPPRLWPEGRGGQRESGPKSSSLDGARALRAGERGTWTRRRRPLTAPRRARRARGTRRTRSPRAPDRARMLLSLAAHVLLVVLLITVAPPIFSRRRRGSSGGLLAPRGERERTPTPSP